MLSLCVCIYSFAALSPATREEERVFHLLKEEEEEEEERALIVSRVCLRFVVGKAALFFLKTGEKEKKEIPERILH